MNAIPVREAGELPVWRLNLLRLFYVVIALGLGVPVWMQLLTATPDWPLMRGVAKSLFAALALLCVLGVRHPSRMLPMLVFEVAWKVLWLSLIAFPAWRAGVMSADQERTFWECIGIVVVIALLPWRYIWRTFVAGRAERWRG
jgi:hypothetical protein